MATRQCWWNLNLLLDKYLKQIPRKCSTTTRGVWLSQMDSQIMKNEFAHYTR
jgi:hypothetical protein